MIVHVHVVYDYSCTSYTNEYQHVKKQYKTTQTNKQTYESERVEFYL